MICTMLKHFLIFFITGNNINKVRDKDGNQDLHQNFKDYLNQFYPELRKFVRLLGIDGCERLGSNESGFKVC